MALALAVIAALICLAAPASLLAASREITDFHSLIVVHPDSSMTVSETITYRTEVRKRGILREFPTTYRDRSGNTITVGFTVLEVWRDGRQEPYHLEKVSNGEKIFVGQKDVFLPPGVYVYTLKYRTDRQLGYFQDFDELYWNVTGNGWELPIDRAEAVIQLPAGTKILKHTAYTGYQGDRGQDYIAAVSGNNITFRTTRGLAPRQGLTVAVSWPKGVVQPPTGGEKLTYFFRDNLSAGVGLAGLLLLLAYYVFVWSKVGRDPAPGTIIPLFQPPPELSPPATRYVMHLGFDAKTMAAAVVDMAVKGYLRIEAAAGGWLSSPTYTLRKTSDNADALPSEEARVGWQLFQAGDSLALKSENHAPIKEALEALQETLKQKSEKTYFVTNLDFFIYGLCLSLLVLGAMVATTPDWVKAGSSALWLIVPLGVAIWIYEAWKSRGWVIKLVVVIVGAVILLPHMPFLAMKFVIESSPVAALSTVAIVLLNPLFYYFLKAPTQAGRRIMDQIEGFKLFLSVAEKERLNLLNPPEKTPELFEKYLPYALALEVEVQWTEQFAQVLAQAGRDGAMYQPSWYSGGSYDSFSAAEFTSSLGSSFADAISSSASPPGSASGGDGGGFSGGGGGGGGGGDW
jgi:uncharacterized membrane protein YgcG